MKTGSILKKITFSGILSGVAFTGVTLLCAGLLVFPDAGRRGLDGLADRLLLRQAGPSRLAMEQVRLSAQPFGRWLAALFDSESTRYTVLGAAGATDTLEKLHAGQVEFGVTTAIALTGQQGLSVIAPVDRHYLHVVSPADGPVAEFRDLAGRRVGVGPEGGAHAALAQALFQFYGFQLPPELISDFGGDLEKAFLDGVIDAALILAPLFDPELEKLLSTGWYRLTPIAVASSVSRYLPGLDADFLPPFAYGPERSLPEVSTPTLSASLLLVSRAEISSGRVRALLRAIYGAAWPDAELRKAWDRVALPGPGIVVHPAAQAFFAPQGPLQRMRWRTAAVFAVALAGLLLCAAWGRALAQARRERARRAAMAPYFKRLLDVGVTEKEAQDQEGLQALLHDMLYTQGRAEKAWISGEIESAHMQQFYAVMALRTQSILRRLEQPHPIVIERNTPRVVPLGPEPYAPPLAQSPPPVEEEPRYYKGMPVVEPEEDLDDTAFGNVVTGPASVRVRKKTEAEPGPVARAAQDPAPAPPVAAKPAPSEVKGTRPESQRPRNKRAGRTQRRAAQKKKAAQQESDDGPSVGGGADHPGQMQLF